MRSFVLYLLAAFLLVSIQAVLFTGVRPDLLLALVCLYSLKYGNIKGMAFGAAAGLIVDSASGFIIGPNVISKFTAAFLINYTRQKFFRWNSLMCAAVIMGITVLDIIWIYFYMKTFSRLLPMNILSDTSVLQAVYTAAAALLLYHIVRPEDGALQNG